MVSPSAAELILNQDGSIYHLGLLPEDLGEVIFLVGDPDRVPVVSSFFDRVELKKQRREFNTHTGYLNQKRVTVMSTGMGTDNIDIALNELDALVNLDLKTGEMKSEHTTLKIIRIGTTGAGSASTALGSYLSTHVACGFDTLGHYYHQPSHSLPIEHRVNQTLQAEQCVLPFYLAQPSQVLYEKTLSFCVPSMTFTWPGFYGPQGRRLRLSPKYPSLLQTAHAIANAEQLVSNFEMETAGILLLAQSLGHHAVSISTVLANRATGAFCSQPEKEVLGMIEATMNMVTSNTHTAATHS